MSNPHKDFTATTQFEGLSQNDLPTVGAEVSAPTAALSVGWEMLPLFAGMDHTAREQFRAAMKVAAFASGDEIIKQGDDGEEMFVLAEGTIRIIVRGADGKVVFERTSAAPAIFGEMSLITREPRSATVVAEMSCVCLRIDKIAVKELFGRHPSTAVFLTRLVGERLMQVQGIRKVGKYEVSGRLGSGGVATVFEARHPSLGIPVALKMLSHALVFDAGFADHFAEEARLVAMLDHENIVRVLDTEQAYGTHFIVMEKLTGELLDELVQGEEPVSWENTRRILREICDALAYSHDHGFVHRDVKPENVFLRTDGRVKLMDFGIATRSGGSDGEGRVFGTPYYMSPEQIQGEELDGRSDLYSLGILAYELVTGTLPFDADTIEDLFEHHMSTPTPDPRSERPGIPEDLVEFILRATEKRPADRFATCHEASAYLKAAAEMPMLDRFAMSSLSVTYHESMRDRVETVLREAARRLAGVRGIVFFEAHRDAGTGQVSTPTGNVRVRATSMPALDRPPPPPGFVPPPPPPMPTAGFVPPPSPPTFVQSAPPSPPAERPASKTTITPKDQTLAVDQAPVEKGTAPKPKAPSRKS